MIHAVVAAAAVAAAVLLRLALDPWLGSNHPLLLVYAAVAFVLWFSGWRLAAVSAIAGYFACHALFIQPRGTHAFGASSMLIGALLYAFSCAVVIGLGEALRRAHQRADLVRADLQREIAERRKTEDELRASEARFRAFMDNSPANAFVKDDAGRYLYMNRVMQSRFGTDRAAWFGKTDADLVGAANGDRYRANDRVVLESGITGEFEERLDDADRSRSYLSFKFPLAGRDGAQLVGGMAFDITARKRMEHAMTRLYELATLCADTTGDSAGCLAQILEAAIEFTGASRGTLRLIDPDSGALELVAQRGFDSEFLRLLAAVQRDTEGPCAEALRTMQRVVVDDIDTCEIFAGLASRALLLETGVRALQSTPLVTGAGKLVGMVSTHFDRPRCPDETALRLMDLLARQAADYLERQNAQEELLRLNEELRDSDRRKDEFIATLAHELRNPLAPIYNAVQVLKRKPLADDVATGRDVIERQAGQMARLLDDLLDVSRISRNRVELRKERVALARVIEAAAETSRPLIDGGAHRLEIDLPREPVHVDADPVRLAQVFSNLLNNAARYSDPGGHIRLHAERNGDVVTIVVADSGHGIDAATLPRIFAMFAQGEPHRALAPAGLGVGLSLAKGLVELHGGTIEARSDGPGKGSAFVVRLPAAARAAPSAPQPANGFGMQSLDRRRLLIADDLRDSAESLATLLRLLGHEVLTAYDGDAAIAAAERFRPDVLLLDIGMPKRSGYDVCRHIRAQPWGRSMCLVAVTGWSQDEDRRRAELAGFDRHLVKPVDIDALAQVVAPQAAAAS